MKHIADSDKWVSKPFSMAGKTLMDLYPKKGDMTHPLHLGEESKSRDTLLAGVKML